MARGDDKFTIRLPAGMREKLALRAQSNNRSANAEYVQILTDALNEPVKVSGYLDESERLADLQAEEFKKIVFETLKSIYKKEKQKQRAIICPLILSALNSLPCS